MSQNTFKPRAVSRSYSASQCDASVATRYDKNTSYTGGSPTNRATRLPDMKGCASTRARVGRCNGSLCSICASRLHANGSATRWSFFCLRVALQSASTKRLSSSPGSSDKWSSTPATNNGRTSTVHMLYSTQPRLHTSNDGCAVSRSHSGAQPDASSAPAVAGARATPGAGGARTHTAAVLSSTWTASGGT